MISDRNHSLFLMIGSTYAHRMDLTLHQLRLLHEIADQGTIAAAADNLGYTPSAVSQQMSSLEKACGVPVLARSGRNVHLTDAGRELVRHAGPLLTGAEAALTAVERVANEAFGVLHLTVYESVAATLLPSLLSALRRDHPGLEVRTSQRDPDLAIDALGRGHVDLAFAIDYPHAPVGARADIVRWPVVDDRFHLIVPDDDPLLGPVVSLADATSRRFISSPAMLSCGRCVVAACRDAGFEPDIVHELDDYPTTLRLVAAGEGLALVPDLGLVSPPPGIRVLDLREPVTRTVQLACRAASADRPALVAVRDTLDEVVRGLRLEAPVRAA